MIQLHTDVPTLAADAPVVIQDWWCTTCGRGEATEVGPDTRLCADCRYMQEGHHRRLATNTAGTSLVRDGLDRGLAEIESAQRLLVDAQLQTERALDAVEGIVYGALGASVDRLHEVGSALLAAHSALSFARLAAPEAR